MRKLHLGKHLLLVSVLFLLLSLLSISGLAAQADNSVIVAADVQDIITLDPARAYEVTNLTVFHAVYETLINVPADDLTALEPGLATSWEVSDDGLTYTFHLREGVTFSSGNPMTAEDVRFSWMRLKNIKGNPSFYADAIDSITVVDDHTLEVTLSAADPGFPQHRHRTRHERDGQRSRQGTRWHRCRRRRQSPTPRRIIWIRTPPGRVRSS